MFDELVKFIREIYVDEEFIPLHAPRFIGNEKKYLNRCIDSTFVSSVGEFVDDFEDRLSVYTGSKYAVATTNGTSALHIALLLANVKSDDEVITQPVTFVATCNAINYCGARPIFIDVGRETMGMSPKSLTKFLDLNTSIKNGFCVNNKTGKIIKACIPVHTFGHPCEIDEIRTICDKNNIFLIEDAAESLGSLFKNKHTGRFGKIGVLSFNGNKIITAGGGGCIITDDEKLAIKAKHLTTTAKLDHNWDYYHDDVGYNYRLPNLNAALICAQMENLEEFLLFKRKLSKVYKLFFNNYDCQFFEEPKNSKSNYWLNSIILKNKTERDLLLEKTNKCGIMTRPIWTLMNRLPSYRDCEVFEINNAEWLFERVVSLPSSVNMNSNLHFKE